MSIEPKPLEQDPTKSVFDGAAHQKRNEKLGTATHQVLRQCGQISALRKKRETDRKAALERRDSLTGKRPAVADVEAPGAA